MYYNIYTPFRVNEKLTDIPFVKLPTKSTDLTYVWNKLSDRMDTVSEQFYSNPFGGKFILMANATICKNEDEIPDGTILVIPFPYNDALQRWLNEVEKLKQYY